MHISDVSAVFQWWFVIFIVGIVFLPITTKIFSLFADKGYLFSKILGIVLTTYLIYVLGISHLISFSFVGIVFVLSLLVTIQFISFLSINKNALKINTDFFNTFTSLWKIFFFEELLFLLALFFWAYIRSFAPEIHGLEKYMDFGFINSILRTEYFPPKDMWQTPDYINYYYFGHIITAVLTKLSGLPSFITYNLMLATIFALCLATAFSLGTNLSNLLDRTKRFFSTKTLLTGLLVMCLVTLGGNLHTLYTFFTPYENDSPVPLWNKTISFSIAQFPNAYWYPNATRFIYNTIHEFPIYSWVVADLHGHVLDIPLVLFVIAFLFHTFQKYINPSILKHKRKERFSHIRLFSYVQSFPLPIFELGLLGFFLGVMYMTNAWDSAIYLLLAGILFGYIFLQRTSSEKTFFKRLISLPRNSRFFVYSFLSFCFVVVLIFIFTTPFNMFFKPFVSGIGVLCVPNELFTLLGKTAIEKGQSIPQAFHLGPLLFEPDHCQKSSLWQLSTLYGFFYFFVAVFVSMFIKKRRRSTTDIFVLLTIIIATILIIIPEFIYLKDIYPAHYRANTMFKMVFQAFIMLSLVSGYIIISSISSFTTAAKTKVVRLGVFFYVVLTVILLSLVFLYPYFAINSYYANLNKYQGLDGTAYLKQLYPSDYDAIAWIQKNISGQPVILEAQGEAYDGASSYTDYARVSANTGLPTVLGWYVHEWLWRGTNEFLGEKVSDVQTLYETTDLQITQDLIKRYSIAYVFVGMLEKEKYQTLSEKKFEQIGKIMYKNEGTTI